MSRPTAIIAGSIDYRVLVLPKYKQNKNTGRYKTISIYNKITFL